jgi:hypothetical protein
MTLDDTSPKARKVYEQRLRELTPSERVRMGVGLCESAYSLQLAGARRKYPDADEAELAFQIAVTRFGAELASKAYRRP